jgi:antitoxin (DNA-binding transcriptional repressor) of toxin-antitoxin stability system
MPFMEVGAMTIVNMQEAKTNLSKLVASLYLGDEVIIANRGVPVAKLEATTSDKKRPLGFIKGILPDSFFDPMPKEEVESWGL